MKLYEITNEMEALNQLYEECIDPDTGEIVDSEVLEELDESVRKILTEKSEGIIKFFRNEELELKMIKEEIERLNTMKKRKERKIEGFKNYILMNMNRIGENRITTPVGNIILRKSVKAIIDETVIPKDSRYWSQEIINKYDKNEIKKLIKDGVQIEGVSFEESVSINIK